MIREFCYIQMWHEYSEKHVWRFCMIKKNEKDGFLAVFIGQFLPIIVKIKYTGIIDDILITIFYGYVLKMIDFWDRVYSEKIEAIYNSDFEFGK